MSHRGVLAIIARTDGAILMQRRDDVPSITWPGYWSILGGGVEAGESEVDAVIREIQEEAGFTVEGPQLLTRVVDHDGSGQGLGVYAAQKPADATLTLGEGQELRFVTTSERSTLKVPPYIRELLEQFAPTR